jgi:hypothetical protein
MADERTALIDAATRGVVSGVPTEAQEREVMTAMKVAGMDSKMIRSLTYTQWKDGIDIDRPATAIMTFARLIRAGLMR